MEFFRIFELLVILAILYLVWRFLKADTRLLKKKVDAALKEEEEGDSKPTPTK